MQTPSLFLCFDATQQHRLGTAGAQRQPALPAAAAATATAAQAAATAATAAAAAAAAGIESPRLCSRREGGKAAAAAWGPLLYFV